MTKTMTEDVRAATEITDEAFAELPSTARTRILRELCNRSCRCSGATIAEAERKRKPIDKRLRELQAIHDRLWREWINEGGPKL